MLEQTKSLHLQLLGWTRNSICVVKLFLGCNILAYWRHRVASGIIFTFSSYFNKDDIFEGELGYTYSN